MSKGSVDEIPDRELIGRAIRSLKNHGDVTRPRWALVMDTFALGSTYARQLCSRYDCDPWQELMPTSEANEE